MGIVMIYKKSIPYVLFILVFSIMMNLDPNELASIQSVLQADQLLQDGKPEDAFSAYSIIANEYPEKTGLYPKIGSAALLSGHFENAIYYLELAKSQGTIDNSGLLHLGDAYTVSGKMNEAIFNWNLIVLNLEFKEEVTNRLIEAYISLSEWDKAIQTIQMWQATSAEDIKMSELLGWIYLFTDPPKAGTIFTQNYNDFDLTYDHARGLAEKYSTIQNEPQQLSLWWVEVGDAMQEHNQFELALKAYDMAIDIDPNNGYGWANSAILKMKSKQSGDAEITQAIQNAENQPGVYAYIADYMMLTNQPEMAVIYLHNALNNSNNDPVILTKLGWLLSDMGNINDGITYLYEAAEAQNSGTGWKNVIIYCLKNGVYIKEIALPSVRYAIALEPHSSEILDLAGDVFIYFKDYITAEKYYLQSTREDKLNYSAHYHLGNLYILIGEFENAREHLVLAADQSSDDQISKEAKVLLSTLSVE